MPDPCVQAPTIDRIDRKIDSLTSAINQLAVQRTEISHLTESLKGLRDWMIKNEARFLALEKAPGAAASRAWVVFYTGGVSAFFGLLFWFATSSAHGIAP